MTELEFPKRVESSIELEMMEMQRFNSNLADFQDVTVPFEDPAK